jgi:acetoin utilization protein AcuB
MSSQEETVARLMTRNPKTIQGNAPVMEAFDTMQEGHFRHLPVMERGAVVGIVSDRDLVESMPPPSVGGSAVQQGRFAMQPVANVMSYCVQSVHVDAPASSAVAVMLSLGVGAVPVVDSAGMLVGIITLVDIAKAFLKANPIQLTEEEPPRQEAA